LQGGAIGQPDGAFITTGVFSGGKNNGIGRQANGVDAGYFYTVAYAYLLTHFFFSAVDVRYGDDQWRYNRIIIMVG
jgi:hypothetical protein